MNAAARSNTVLPYNVEIDPAIQWLATIMRGHQPNCALPKEITEQELLQLARTHGCLSLISHQLETGQQQLDVFPTFRQVARSQCLRNASLDMLLGEELRHVLEVLHNNNIACLLLKGEALAHTIYPEPYLRERCDTDILLPDKQAAERVWRLLKEEGYDRANTLTGEFVGHQFSCYKSISPSASISLDIHSKISDYNFFANTFSFEYLFENRIHLPKISEFACGLHPVHALVHACMHRIGHIPHGQENKLIWLYDIHLLGESFSDEEWRYVIEFVKERKMAIFSFEGLITAQLHFDSKFPGEYLQQLCDMAEEETSMGLDSNKRWRFYYEDFKRNKGLLNKATQLREHLIPPVAYMVEKYHPTSRLFLPYYYLKRIIIGVKKYV